MFHTNSQKCDYTFVNWYETSIEQRLLPRQSDRWYKP